METLQVLYSSNATIKGELKFPVKITFSFLFELADWQNKQKKKQQQQQQSNIQ